MQIYSMKLFNFLRFGESNNTIVLDLSVKEKDDLKCGNISMDQIYERVMESPIDHIKKVKARGIEGIIGVTGIVGENDERSNGVGKSSIFEGICFAFFEKISRKTVNTDKVEKAGLSVVTKIDGKIPENVKASFVEILFEENNRIYRLKRGRDFAKSQKSSTPFIEFDCINKGEIDSLSSHRTGDTKESISDVITIDYDVFIASQMFAQNDAGKFLMGTDKTKKEMLISLLKLENVVSGCLELIREKKNAQDKTINGVKSKIELYDSKFKKEFPDFVEINKEFALSKVKIYDDEIALKTLSVKEKEKAVSEISNKIAELSSSDKFITLEEIKEAGKAIKNAKEEKEKEMNSKVSEWSKLVVENTIKVSAKRKEIESFNSKIRFKEDEVKSLNNFIGSLTTEIAKYGDITSKAVEDKNKKLDIENKIKELGKKRDELKEEISSNNTLINIADTNLKKLSSKMASAKNSGKFTCSECNSEVTVEHITAKISEYESSKKASIEKRDALIIKRDKVETESSDLYDVFSKIPDWDKIAIKLESLKSDLSSKRSLLANVKNSLSEYSSSIKNNDKEIEELNVKISEYDEKISNIKKSFDDVLKTLAEQLNELKKKYSEADVAAKAVSSKIEELKASQNLIALDIKRLSEEVGRCRSIKEDFIKSVKEFRDIKIKLIEETKVMDRYLLLEDIYGLDGIQTRIVKRYLPLLNVHIKEFLDILSDGEIAVKMVVNDKQKVDMIISGGTSDSFEMLSGGEKMIIRLATDIGLSLLAFCRTTQKPELIALDEIFSNLDVSRVSNVFRMLKKLKDKFSRVLIITHDAEIKEKIESNIIIKKDIGKNALSQIVRIT